LWTRITQNRRTRKWEKRKAGKKKKSVLLGVVLSLSEEGGEATSFSMQASTEGTEQHNLEGRGRKEWPAQERLLEDDGRKGVLGGNGILFK